VKIQPAKVMIVAGVMSGTSADGVDVALCRIAPRKDNVPQVKVLALQSFAYEKKLRAAVLAVASGEAVTAAEISRLNWRLGAVYAECIEKTVAPAGVKIALVACHGQTIYHQAAPATYLGAPVRCTWQLGEPSVIAERLRVPVVSDFRPADMAAGGQGAPLVPMLDYCVFHHATKNRLLLNLGGIANVTALPAGGDANAILAFDTGPANMVIDAVMQRLYQRGYDRNGAVAAKGKVLGDAVVKAMGAAYFSALPPKSCGREEFGAAFVEAFIGWCGDARPEDIVATATALTVETIAEAYRIFCCPWLGKRAPLAKTTELLVAGGGAKNKTLMLWLAEKFAGLGVKVTTTEPSGLAVEAKEAAAFALLGWLTWHGLPGNIPSATGASRGVVLGKVTHG
jgi:anhydro-N-acetylmuramic acid kinase